ncbi:MAG: beta-propeller fold lactonase family protein, partial [Verrucomicrobiota bacterium]
MKAVIALVIFAFVSSALAAPTVVVSGAGHVSVFELNDGQTPRLSLIQSFAPEGGAGGNGWSPDKSLLYLDTQLDGEPAIATFRVLEDGKIEQVAIARSTHSCGYLRAHPSGMFLAGNQYKDGKVMTWAVDEKGIFRGELVRAFDLEKCAHSAVFSKDGRYLFVPATKPNKIFQLKFNSETGDVIPNQPSSSPGSRSETDSRNPRHLVFHPKLPVAYSTNENQLPGVGVWSFDSERGLLENVQNLLSIEGDPEGQSTADLHLSPNGKFLYVSNRDGKNKKAPVGRDALALFAVDSESGKLTFKKRIACQRIPRSFNIGPL